MRTIAAAGVVLASCAYQAGSFDSTVRPFVGQRVTVGCLDLAIDRRPDLPNGDSVVSYDFGNRCDHPVVVDLARVAVVGRAADGGRRDLKAYDPDHEIAPMRIDGRAVGGEAIAYSSAVSPHEICIDAATIAHVETTQWLCLARPHLTEVP
jgi:hypothetical protein